MLGGGDSAPVDHLARGGMASTEPDGCQTGLMEQDRRPYEVELDGRL